MEPSEMRVDLLNGVKTTWQMEDFLDISKFTVLKSRLLHGKVLILDENGCLVIYNYDFTNNR